MCCFSFGLICRQSNIGLPDLLLHAWWSLSRSKPGAAPHGFAFSFPDSSSLEIPLAMTALTSQTFCACILAGCSNLSLSPCWPSLCPVAYHLSPLLALCLLFCLLALAWSCCLVCQACLLGSSSTPPVKALESLLLGKECESV